MPPFRKNPKPGNPAFPAHSTDTSPTLTSWPPDFTPVHHLRLPRRHRQRGDPSYHRPEEPPKLLLPTSHLEFEVNYGRGVLADPSPSTWRYARDDSLSRYAPTLERKSVRACLRTQKSSSCHARMGFWRGTTPETPDARHPAGPSNVGGFGGVGGSRDPQGKLI